MLRTLLAVVGILGSSILPRHSEAATVLALTVEEMAAGADRVIRARVVSQRSEIDSANGLIFSLTTLDVLEEITGEGPATVVLRQLGGMSEAQGLHLEGDARFEMGEEVVVFLRSGTETQGFVHLQALGLSKFRVEEVESQSARMAVRDLSGLHLVRRDGLEVRPARELELDDLLMRIRRGAELRQHLDPWGGER